MQNLKSVFTAAAQDVYAGYKDSPRGNLAAGGGAILLALGAMAAAGGNVAAAIGALLLPGLLLARFYSAGHALRQNGPKPPQP